MPPCAAICACVPALSMPTLWRCPRVLALSTCAAATQGHSAPSCTAIRSPHAGAIYTHALPPTARAATFPMHCGHSGLPCAYLHHHPCLRQSPLPPGAAPRCHPCVCACQPCTPIHSRALGSSTPPRRHRPRVLLPSPCATPTRGHPAPTCTTIHTCAPTPSTTARGRCPHAQLPLEAAPRLLVSTLR